MPIAQAYVVSPTHLSKVTSDLKQNWKNLTGEQWERTLVTDAITLFLNQAPLSYNLNIGTVKEYARTEQHDRSYNIEHGRYPPTYVRVFLLVVDQK